MLPFCDISELSRSLWLPMAFSARYRSTSGRPGRVVGGHIRMIAHSCLFSFLLHLAPLCAVWSFPVYGQFPAMRLHNVLALCSDCAAWEGKVLHGAGWWVEKHKKNCLAFCRSGSSGYLWLSFFSVGFSGVICRASPVFPASKIRCLCLILDEAVSGHFGGLFQSHDVED